MSLAIKVMPEFECVHPKGEYCKECCNHDEESCSYEDDSECVICRSCKEWTSEVKCKYCEETILESACCG